MSESSAPPPGTGGPQPEPPRSVQPVVIRLAAPGGVRRLLGGRGKGEHRLTLTPQEIVVEHAGDLRAPLRFAPGSIVVASIDRGTADVSKARGRFPILRRLGDRVIPREEGIEGWVWTSADGSAFVVLGDAAPNAAFVFSPPLSGERIEEAFEPDVLADLAKRSPLGQPAVFGLLVHTEEPEMLGAQFERFGIAGVITDREIPPVQRRHLPDDKPANPEIQVGEASRAGTSVPPPGMS